MLPGKGRMNGITLCRIIIVVGLIGLILAANYSAKLPQNHVTPYKIMVVTIDGEDYIVAKSWYGIGICPKVAK